MLEKQVEQALVAKARKQGGIALKFVSPSYDGMPDRLVLMPGGHMGFVEVKAPKKKPRALQVVRMNMLKRLGAKVYVLDDIDNIDNILVDIMGGEGNGV